MSDLEANLVPEFVDLTLRKQDRVEGDEPIVSQRQGGQIDVIVPNISAMPDTFLIDTSDCDLEDGATHALAMIVPGPDKDVRFEIGEARVIGNSTQLKLFGEANGSTVHFVF